MMTTKKCNPKDCNIVNGLCLTHGYSVSETVKCEKYNAPLRSSPYDEIIKMQFNALTRSEA